MEDAQTMGQLLAWLKPAMALMIAVVMLAMGASITFGEIKDCLKKPVPILIGMGCQFGLMPMIAFFLAKTFALGPVQTLSLIILGASPGGSTSNLFTYWAKGVVALSCTMTFCSTVASALMYPLLISFYSENLIASSLVVPYKQISAICLMVLVPVCLGATIKEKRPNLARKIEVIGGRLGVVFIIAIIFASFVSNPEVYRTGARPYLVALALPLLGLGASFVISKLSKLTAAIRNTVMIETAIQNTALAMTIITLSFEEKLIAEMVMIPGHYGVMVSLIGLIIVVILKKTQRR